jgi:hypothetical protein
MDFSYYIVENAVRKCPDIHVDFIGKSMIGQLCFIGLLETGHSAILRVIMPSDKTRFHTVLTSVVDDYKETDGGSRMEIITMNSRYFLRRATMDEVHEQQSALIDKPITTPVKLSGYYGQRS